MPITCQRIGRPPISTRAFGTVSVLSRRRVPRPPQRITTGGFIASALFLAIAGVSAEARSGAAGDCGEDGDFVALVDLGVETLLEADVLAVDVDVDEAAQVPVLG